MSKEITRRRLIEWSLFGLGGLALQGSTVFRLVRRAGEEVAHARTR